jgi:hypothetical protein
VNKIDDKILKQIRDDLVGKRICIIDEKLGKLCGICSFIGYNEWFPEWELQVTIDRMPVTNVKLNKIESLC